MGDKRRRNSGEKSTLAQEVHYSAQLSQAKVAPGWRGSRRWPGGGALHPRPRLCSQNNLAPPTRLCLLFIKVQPVFSFLFFLPLFASVLFACVTLCVCRCAAVLAVP